VLNNMKTARDNTKPGTKELREARNASTHFLATVFGFSVFVNLLMLTGPLFMLQIYDRVLGSGSEETLVALFMLVG
jgi:ATP-binding cassette subfamily C protein